MTGSDTRPTSKGIPATVAGGNKLGQFCAVGSTHKHCIMHKRFGTESRSRVRSVPHCPSRGRASLLSQSSTRSARVGSTWAGPGHRYVDHTFHFRVGGRLDGRAGCEILIIGGCLPGKSSRVTGALDGRAIVIEIDGLSDGTVEGARPVRRQMVPTCPI